MYGNNHRYRVHLDFGFLSICTEMIHVILQTSPNEMLTHAVYQLTILSYPKMHTLLAQIYMNRRSENPIELFDYRPRSRTTFQHFECIHSIL